MNPMILKQFHENIPLREAVRTFMLAMLREVAADRAFTGESTTGIIEAKEVVDKSFDKLDELYGKIEKSEIPSPR